MDEASPDAIILAGDAGNTLEHLSTVLSLFDHIDARKLFVAGNHDVWIESQNGRLLDSREKYLRRIPEVCEQAGFHDLSHGPAVIDNVGFVGSLGWYDYTFADPRLDLDANDYWQGRYEDEIWWDKEMTFWPSSSNPGIRARDPEVCSEFADALAGHIAQIEKRVDRIVAVIHTLSFVDTLPRSDPPYYFDAYAGAERLGRVVEANAKVTHCINGHKHISGGWTMGHIQVARRILGCVDADANIDEQARAAVGIIEL